MSADKVCNMPPELSWSNASVGKRVAHVLIARKKNSTPPAIGLRGTAYVHHCVFITESICVDVPNPNGLDAAHALLSDCSSSGYTPGESRSSADVSAS